MAFTPRCTAAGKKLRKPTIFSPKLRRSPPLPDEEVVHCPGQSLRPASRGEITMSDTIKYVLDEQRLPKSWYNIAADLPAPPPPPLHPGTGQPIGPGDLAPLFPMELIKQVVATDREIEIPEPVRDAYK